MFLCSRVYLRCCLQQRRLAVNQDNVHDGRIVVSWFVRWPRTHERSRSGAGRIRKYVGATRHTRRTNECDHQLTQKLHPNLQVRFQSFWKLWFFKYSSSAFLLPCSDVTKIPVPFWPLMADIRSEPIISLAIYSPDCTIITSTWAVFHNVEWCLQLMWLIFTQGGPHGYGWKSGRHATGALNQPSPWWHVILGCQCERLYLQQQIHRRAFI